MEISEYKNIYLNESSHFYYVGIHSIIISLIKKYLPNKTPRILDAGCGTGLLAKKMSSIGKVFAIDLSKEAIKYARRRDVNAQIASINKIPFPKNHFDMVTCIDVINLIEVSNDKNALKEIFRVLKPNGILIMRASAIPWLNSEHDICVHIKKRYTISEMRSLLTDASFEIKKLSYINFFLFVPALFKHIKWKISKKSNPTSTIRKVNPLLNKIVIYLTKLEEILIKNINLPIGNGIIAVAKKTKP